MPNFPIELWYSHFGCVSLVCISPPGYSQVCMISSSGIQLCASSPILPLALFFPVQYTTREIISNIRFLVVLGNEF